MKTFVALMTGTCIGILGCYTVIQKFPAFGIGMSVAEASQTQSETPLITPDVVRYTNEDEGLKLQTNKMIDHKSYSNTEGKIGDLFRIKNQCKIRITIGGENSLIYRTFYFADQELTHALAATYYYPSGDTRLSERAEDNAFRESLFSEETFNPKNPTIIEEFKALSEQFTPEQIKSC